MIEKIQLAAHFPAKVDYSTCKQAYLPTRSIVRVLDTSVSEWHIRLRVSIAAGIADRISAFSPCPSTTNLNFDLGLFNPYCYKPAAQLALSCSHNIRLRQTYPTSSISNQLDTLVYVLDIDLYTPLSSSTSILQSHSHAYPFQRHQEGEEENIAFSCKEMETQG